MIGRTRLGWIAFASFLAPSGGLTFGVALVLRHVVQRCLGLWTGLAAIGIGRGLSASVAPGALVLASVLAFALSELADFAVYTPLQRRLLRRVAPVPA